jgi:hypothetical protein
MQNRFLSGLTTAARVTKALLLPAATATATGLSHGFDPSTAKDDTQLRASLVLPILSGFNIALSGGEFAATITDLVTSGVWSKLSASSKNTLISAAMATSIHASIAIYEFATGDFTMGGIYATGAVFTASFGSQAASLFARQLQREIAQTLNETTSLIVKTSPV